MSPHAARRVAFTLIELLVVMAIIAVLLALLLPAIQKVREAANRTSCQNNLKQLGIALVHYQASHRSFPPGAVTRYGSLPVRHSWGPYVLPFIEQENLQKQYLWNANWFDANNQRVVTTQVRLLQCPSVPTSNRIDVTPIGSAAISDYSPTAEVDNALITLGLVTRPANNDGVMAIDSKVQLGELVDGASQTILMAEVAGRPELWQTSRQAPGARAAGGGWADFENVILLRGASSNGATSPGPCAVSCTNNREMYSFHPGGVNVVLVDGSVHVLRASIDIRVAAALVTYAGKEVISGSDF